MAALAAVCVLPIGRAHAQSFSAGFLYDRCHGNTAVDKSDGDRLICASYIRGIVDTIRVQAFNATGSAEAHIQAMPFCLPTGTDANATIDAFVRHVEARRAARTDGAAMTVVEALRAMWPCPR